MHADNGATPTQAAAGAGVMPQQPERPPPMTPAERQQRRRDKLKQQKQASQQTASADIDSRKTRQEAWDAAAETISLMIEDYRSWRTWNPAPASAPSIHQLPRLAAMALTLAMVELPDDFGTDWYFRDDEPVEKQGIDVDPRSLREQLLSARPLSFDPDHFPRTPENDQKAREWWGRLPPEGRTTWLRIAGTADPVEAWYLAIDCDAKAAAIKRR